MCTLETKYYSQDLEQFFFFTKSGSLLTFQSATGTNDHGDNQ